MNATPRRRPYPTLALAAALLLLGACSRVPRTVRDLAGVYALERVDDQRLPTEPGRLNQDCTVSYTAGTLRLTSGGRYTMEVERRVSCEGDQRHLLVHPATSRGTASYAAARMVFTPSGSALEELALDGGRLWRDSLHVTARFESDIPSTLVFYRPERQGAGPPGLWVIVLFGAISYAAFGMLAMPAPLEGQRMIYVVGGAIIGGIAGFIVYPVLMFGSAIFGISERAIFIASAILTMVPLAWYHRRIQQQEEEREFTIAMQQVQADLRTPLSDRARASGVGRGVHAPVHPEDRASLHQQTAQFLLERLTRGEIDKETYQRLLDESLRRGG